jgi:ssDNA-binding Zn-finger/Zn-ribbon topoisomerase 1
LEVVALDDRSSARQQEGPTVASKICADCGVTSNGKMRTKGSFLMEIVLWLCLIVPGLIYSLWRLTTKERVCPSCDSKALIDPRSPRGKALMQEYHNLNLVPN